MNLKQALIALLRSFFYLLLILVIGVPVLIFLVLSHLPPDFVKANYIEAFKIPSSAMAPALMPGDRILVSKTYYQTQEARRGDIVVFTLPDDLATPDVDESFTNIVKRIVAVGGDTVEVEGAKLLIDDSRVEEAFAVWDLGGIKNFAPAKVPRGSLFLLGDNRDHSKDSRYWPSPFVDEKRIIGKVIFIYWPPGRMGSAQ